MRLLLNQNFLIKFKGRFRNRFKRIDRSTIVFSCLGYRYDDSPKFICYELHKLSPNTKMLWLLTNENKKDIPDYIKAIEPDSNEAVNALSKSIAVIGNGFGNISVFKRKNIGSFLFYLLARFSLRKDQYFFTTWHGTPIKKIGKDDDKDIRGYYVANGIAYLDNKFVADIITRSTYNQMQIRLLGQPRNDYLKSRNNVIQKKLRNKIGLPCNKKIILYAPTFKMNRQLSNKENIWNSGLNQLNKISFDNLFKHLNMKFGGEWIFVARFHNVVEKRIDWNELYSKYKGNVINGNMYADMTDYLICADILLTDISSCVFDFAYSNKPAFLFFPDRDKYERQLYFKLEELPFPVSINFEKLLDDIDNFDASVYVKGINDMRASMGYIDVEKSSRIIAEDILKTIGI